jgi:hypothetical protein
VGNILVGNRVPWWRGGYFREVEDILVGAGKRILQWGGQYSGGEEDILMG